MNIYLLEDTKSPIWDAYNAHVVMAKSPKEARAIAADAAHCNADIWLDPKRVTCHDVTKRKKEGIILSSYVAG